MKKQKEDKKIQEKGKQIKLVVESKKTSKFLSKVNKLFCKGNFACVIIGEEKENYHFVLKGKVTKPKIDKICKDINCDIKVEFREKNQITIYVDDLNKIDSKTIKKLTLTENYNKLDKDKIVDKGEQQKLEKASETLDKQEIELVEGLEEEVVEPVENLEKKAEPVKDLEKEKIESLEVTRESLNQKEIVEYCLSCEKFTIKQLMEHFKPLNQKEKNRIYNTIFEYVNKKWVRSGRGEYKIVKKKKEQEDSKKKEENP